LSEKIQIMRDLAEWFKEYGWAPSFNQKTPDGYPVFHANTNAKADLLLTKNDYNVLVEVKSGREHQDILDGMDQVWKYAGEYYSGRAIYFCNDRKIICNAFVLATKYSRYGYLYANESQLNYLEYGFLSDAFNMIEKPISHSITRFLWRQWEKGLIFDYFERLRAGKAGPLVVPPNKPRVGTVLAKTEARTRQIDTMPYLYLNSNEFVPMGSRTIRIFEEG